MLDFPKTVRDEILKGANYNCRVCGFHDRDMVHVDHIIPRGHADCTQELKNAAPLCWKCNADKGDILGVKFPQKVQPTNSEKLQQRRRRNWRVYLATTKKAHGTVDHPKG